MQNNRIQKVNLQLFAMKNLDTVQQKKTEIMQKLTKAIKDGDEEGFTQAFNDLSDNIQQAVMEEAKGIVQAVDVSVLSGRGVRQLTSDESNYYQEVIQAMQSSNPKQSLTDLDVVMPKTVIDAVFEDLTTNHPLLDAVNFQNTSGLIEYLVNTNGTELATWGTLTAEIAKELSSGFKKINMQLFKLSSFLPVAKAMLDLGPAWLDRYTRAMLGEALSFGLEEGIINGTGKNMPIGMNRQVGDGVTVTDGVYPIKSTVKVTSLDAKSYGALIAGMAIGPNSKTRIVDRVILICNPVDYLKKIMPATTIRGADGAYVNNVFPFPTTVIQSTQVPQNRAIFGLAKRYFMGVGTAKSGKIEYSDEYHFLEDERMYLVKLYGYGEPLDNSAFVYADISELEEAASTVKVTNFEDLAADATLSALTIGSLTLSPTFNKDKYFYTVATTNASNAVTATATDADGSAITITVNGTALANGSAPTWAAGVNNVVITVMNGASILNYVVVVTKS